VASLAFAGDRDRSHPRSWGDGRGHQYKRCHDQRVSAWDEQWLKMSLETDLFEILGGQAAQEKATTEVVRALAARVVQDHSASYAVTLLPVLQEHLRHAEEALASLEG
jgi:hypothetical protein